MANVINNNLSISISQTLRELDRARCDLLNFLVANKTRDDIISRLELSVYEVLINVVDHAPDEYRDKKIDIECNISDDNIRVEISNYGDEYDIRIPELPDIDEHVKAGERRGLGLYIIRRLMDEVDYSYKDHISRLTLTVKK